MTKTERFNKVVEYLLENRKIYNRSDLAGILNKHKSYISEVSNGKRDLSEQFVLSLCSKFPELSASWLMTEEGSMIIDADSLEQFLTEQDKQIATQQQTIQDLSSTVRSLSETIAEQQRTIARLQNEKDALEKRIAEGSISAKSAPTSGVVKTPRP